MARVNASFAPLALCAVWYLAVHTYRVGASASSEDAAAPASSEDGGADYEGTKYFSVPAFFVTFRETIEAVVIISVLLRFLEKIDRPELKPAVWKGAFTGLGTAILVGVAFIIAFYETGDQFFKGNTEYIVEAILMLVASGIITVLSASMLKIAHMREKWERKLQRGMAQAEARGEDLKKGYMFWLPLTAVLREGIETIIFLAGTSSGYPAESIPIPGILGIVVGLAIGWFIFRAGKEASLKKLLIASTVLLLFIAAGLFSHGVHELQEVEMFGTWEPSYERGHMNSPSWSICDDADNDDHFWSIIRALFGYTCDPTPIEIIAYVLYWVLALTYLSFKLSIWAEKDTSQMKGVDSEERAQDVEAGAQDNQPVRPVVSA